MLSVGLPQSRIQLFTNVHLSGQNDVADWRLMQQHPTEPIQFKCLVVHSPFALIDGWRRHNLWTEKLRSAINFTAMFVKHLNGNRSSVCVIGWSQSLWSNGWLAKKVSRSHNNRFNWLNIFAKCLENGSRKHFGPTDRKPFYGVNLNFQPILKFLWKSQCPQTAISSQRMGSINVLTNN